MLITVLFLWLFLKLHVDRSTCHVQIRLWLNYYSIHAHFTCCPCDDQHVFIRWLVRIIREKNGSPGLKWGGRALNLIAGMTFLYGGLPLSPVDSYQVCLLSWLVSVILIRQNAQFDVLKVKISAYRHFKVESFLDAVCPGFHFGSLLLHSPFPTPAGAPCCKSPGWSVQAADLCVVLVRQSPPPRPLQGSASHIRWEFCYACLVSIWGSSLTWKITSYPRFRASWTVLCDCLCRLHSEGNWEIAKSVFNNLAWSVSLFGLI